MHPGTRQAVLRASQAVFLSTVSHPSRSAPHYYNSVTPWRTANLTSEGKSAMSSLRINRLR